MIKTNKKLIKLNDDEISELTLDECYIIYKPILIKLTNSYHNIKLEFDDRFQIACIGLIKAYKTYNNTKYPFIAYLKIVVNNEFIVPVIGSIPNFTVLSFVQSLNAYCDKEVTVEGISI